MTQNTRPRTQRYVITTTPDQRMWGILDRYLYGYCTLPDGEGNFLPLEWKMREGAEAWLYKCRVAWGTGFVPAPEGWNSLRPEPSPWDAAYYNR
jgi:hypothetical protein